MSETEHITRAKIALPPWPHHFWRFFDAYNYLVQEYGDKFTSQPEDIRYLATIDLTDGYCYHPIQFRLAVQRSSAYGHWVRGQWTVEEPKFAYMVSVPEVQATPWTLWYCSICGFMRTDETTTFAPKDTGRGPRHRMRVIKAMRQATGRTQHTRIRAKATENT